MLNDGPSMLSLCARLVLLWAAPVLLLGQYVGNVPETPIYTSLAYLGLFVAVLWLGGPPEHASSSADQTFGALEAESIGRRGLGIVFGIAGLAAWAIGGAHLLEIQPIEGWIRGTGWLDQRAGYLLLTSGAAWPLAWSVPLVQGRTIEARDFVRMGGCIGCSLLALLASEATYQGLEILRLERITARLVTAGAGLCMITLLLRPKPDSRVSFALILLVVSSLRGLGLETWSPHPQTRDMLPLIQGAHEVFLSGDNPYRVYQMQQGSQVPLTYLPGLWGLYVIPALLDLDIRWMSLLSDVLVVSTWWWLARNGSSDPRHAWSRSVALGLGAVWATLPSLHWNGIYAEPHVWWGVLAIWLASVLERRWWIAAGLTGLAVATRHFGVVVLPFVMIAMVADVGWRASLPRFGLAGLVASVLLLPPVAADPGAFWFGTVHWLREYGPVHQNWFYDMIGFSGPMYEHNVDAWLIWIQAIALAASVGGYAIWTWRTSRRDPGHPFVASAGTAYIIFIMFNGIIWHSFYLGAFLFVGHSLVTVSRSEPPAGADSSTEMPGGVWWIGTAVCALSLVAGGWLGSTLYTYYSTRGLESMRETLRERLERGDHLLDRTHRNLEFVEGEPIFAAGRHPSGVEVHERLFERTFLFESDVSSMWVAARTSWRRDEIRRLERLGRVQYRSTFGHYTLLELDVFQSIARLSQRLHTFSPTYEGLTSGETDAYRKHATQSGPVWRAPSRPTWVEIKPKQCEIGPLRERLLYVHPHRNTALHLTWEHLKLGQSLLIYGGIEDRVIRWNRGEVSVALFIDGRHRRTLTLPNRPGPWWVSFETPRSRGEPHDVELVVTTRDDRQRWTCLEGVVLGRERSSP